MGAVTACEVLNNYTVLAYDLSVLNIHHHGEYVPTFGGILNSTIPLLNFGRG